MVNASFYITGQIFAKGTVAASGECRKLTWNSLESGSVFSYFNSAIYSPVL
jgi:hypothetical protein